MGERMDKRAETEENMARDKEQTVRGFMPLWGS